MNKTNSKMISQIRESIINVAEKYAISKVTLFGSQASGTATEDSDIDLMVEFNKPVTLITLSSLKYDLEEMLNKNVDVIHGPLRDTDYIEFERTVDIYEA